VKAIEKYEVGHFRDLSARPNPAGLVVYPVPSFEDVFQIVEQEVGRPLTEAELGQAKGNAACIVLPREEADAMERTRAKKK
jgi:hypothetical protein